MTSKSTKYKVLFSVLALVFVISAFTLYGVIVSNNDYVDDLTDIYSKYDTELTIEQKQEPLGLRRLVVFDYDGNRYNAKEVAVDKKNNIAVLQYESVDDTANAYNDMLSDGVDVDIDCIVELDENTQYSKCDISPEHSQMLQFPQYLNNYNMNYDDVIVAVVDTGVMLDHTYLKDRFYSRGLDFSSDKNNDADYCGYVNQETSTHSTMISGIIANNTPDNVKILPIKVVPRGERYAPATSVVAGLNAAVDMGASVVNISISGSSGATIYKKAIDNAVNKGVCVCVSAGNSGEDMQGRFPASIPEAITCGAIKTNKQIEYYSNFGSEIDFVAPGTNIVSCAPDKNGNSSYAAGSGTSFSTPYIAACVANIKSINNNFSVSEIYDFLLTRVEDLGDNGRDIYYGNGLINMGNFTFNDDSYCYKIPQGTLDIYKSVDYIEDTQPWKMFNNKLETVTVSQDLQEIGDYNFYNMSSAEFNLPDNLLRVGKFAFYGCSSLKEMTFSTDVREIGACAFGNNLPDFRINGYTNTPAELYAKAENIAFNSLGCNHNFIVDVVEPTQNQAGYTLYTCCVCGDSNKGPYIEPKVISSGACGDGLTYSLYDIGKLKIDGIGKMYDYISEQAPWSDYASDIKILEITSGIETISPLAFYGCNNLIKINNFSSTYDVFDDCLYSKDMSELVLYAGGKNQNILKLLESVTNFNAQAMICANKIHDIKTNSNFTFKDNILYDKNDNIVLFMPYCTLSEITISKPISIKENAMILCSSVDKIFVDHPEAQLQNFSVGYKYDGIMNKRDLVINGCDKALAQNYANQNGFIYVTMNKGYCGDNIYWQYDEQNREITLTGSGNMYDYNLPDDVPWSKFMPSIKSVKIDDGISKLSRYAFYDAKALTNLVMPISIKACMDDTTWYNCVNIKSIELTHATGYMDDYGTGYDQIIYQNTPWYISRKSITSIKIDPNVKYIGNYAFRNCLAIKNVTLLDCDEIGDYAFIACSNCSEMTIKSDNTLISDYALFSYKGNIFNTYKSSVMNAHVGSTAQAYCEKFGIKFNPIDCNHFVKGVVTNKSNQLVSGAEFYIADVLVARTNINGQFVACNLECGNHNYKLFYNNLLLSQGSLNVEHTNYQTNICVAVGDYVADGVINTKDYAEANKKGYRMDNIDLGEKFERKESIFQAYDYQPIPSVSSITVEREPNSVVCNFTAHKDFNTEFTVTECGFLFGSDLPDDFLVIENVGNATGNSGVLKRQVANIESITTVLPYGVKSATGKISARFYVKYSNEVNDYIYYSDVATYTY